MAQIDPRKLRKKQTVNVSVSLKTFTRWFGFWFVLGFFEREGKKKSGKDVNIKFVLLWGIFGITK